MTLKVAIIGTGFGGMFAADVLTTLGYHVTMYEKATRPGGRVTSCATWALSPGNVSNFVGMENIMIGSASQILFEPAIRVQSTELISHVEIVQMLYNLWLHRSDQHISLGSWLIPFSQNVRAYITSVIRFSLLFSEEIPLVRVLPLVAYCLSAILVKTELLQTQICVPLTSMSMKQKIQQLETMLKRRGVQFHYDTTIGYDRLHQRLFSKGITPVAPYDLAFVVAAHTDLAKFSSGTTPTGNDTSGYRTGMIRLKSDSRYVYERVQGNISRTFLAFSCNWNIVLTLYSAEPTQIYFVCLADTCSLSTIIFSGTLKTTAECTNVEIGKEVSFQIGLDHDSVLSCVIDPFGPSYQMYECSTKDHVECTVSYGRLGSNIYLCGDNFRTSDDFNTVDSSLLSVKAAIHAAGLNRDEKGSFVQNVREW